MSKRILNFFGLLLTLWLPPAQAAAAPPTLDLEVRPVEAREAQELNTRVDGFLRAAASSPATPALHVAVPADAADARPAAPPEVKVPATTGGRSAPAPRTSAPRSEQAPEGGVAPPPSSVVDPGGAGLRMQPEDLQRDPDRGGPSTDLAEQRYWGVQPDPEAAERAGRGGRGAAPGEDGAMRPGRHLGTELTPAEQKGVREPPGQQRRPAKQDRGKSDEHRPVKEDPLPQGGQGNGQGQQRSGERGQGGTNQGKHGD